MAHVAVIGAGFAGLATGLFLARRGHTVELIEKDAAAPPDDVEACFADWTRRGVAQARQPHLLLSRGVRVLQEEAPETLAAFCAAGASLLTNLGQRKQAGDREAVFFIAARRLPMEAAMRGETLGRPSISLTLGEVDALIARREGGEPPLVTGVALADGRKVEADLVVDASGRWSKAPEHLAAIGADPVGETSQDLQFCYLSQWRRKRAGAPFPPGFMPLTINSAFAPFICFPADGGVFSVTMAVSLNDPLRGKLRRPEVFERVANAIKGFEPWLDQTDAITEPQVMARIENRWRSLAPEGRAVVRGFALVGDSAIHTNPTFGRGISFACLQARWLAEALEERDLRSAAFTREFEAWKVAELLGWYQAQLVADGRRLAGIERALRGQALPEPDDAPSRFVAALSLIAPENPQIAAALSRMMHMLTTPQELARDPVVGPAVAKRLEAGGSLLPPMAGPSRAEFEALVA